MKTKTTFRCQNCQYEAPKWLGKCPNCNNWNSFVETVSAENPVNNQRNVSSETGVALQPQTLQEVLAKSIHGSQRRNYVFASKVLNDFWNQGLPAGSITLLAGEPGLGKSTLGLQLLRALFNYNSEKNNSEKQSPENQEKLKLLYITAEESVLELARRSERLNIPKGIMVLQTNNFEQIEKVLLDFRPQVAIIDSIQTVFSSQIASAPGSISQVSQLASQFLAISKSLDISIILIGHVTKEGQIAGPKTLEHLVDSVLLLESSDASGYRTLTFSKHRYGSTEQQLLLKMETGGLEIVTDPSLALLENLENGVGVCYGLAMDKNLPLVVEVQALVSKPANGQGFFGRRETLGIKTSKLNTILAISEKYLDLDLRSRDVYVQLTGLAKNLADDSLDLPILIAILSSITQKNVTQLLLDSQNKSFSPVKNASDSVPVINLEKPESKTKQTGKNKTIRPIFAGRLTLSGNLRVATSNKEREKTAKNLGFSYNDSIQNGELVTIFRGFY